MRESDASGRKEEGTARAQFRRRSFTFYCLLYIGLGTASLVAGLGMGYATDVFGRRAYLREARGLQIVCAILVVFGIVRIVNALFQLRRMNGRPGGR